MRDATELPWRATADIPASFGTNGLTAATVIEDDRGRRVLRLCPAGTRGVQADQAAAAVTAMIALANAAIGIGPAARALRAGAQSGAGQDAGAPRP